MREGVTPTFYGHVRKGGRRPPIGRGRRKNWSLYNDVKPQVLQSNATAIKLTCNQTQLQSNSIAIKLNCNQTQLQSNSIAIVTQLQSWLNCNPNSTAIKLNCNHDLIPIKPLMQSKHRLRLRLCLRNCNLNSIWIQIKWPALIYYVMSIKLLKSSCWVVSFLIHGDRSENIESYARS